MAKRPKRDLDAQTYDLLQSRGDNPAKPRHTMAYFFMAPKDPRGPEFVLDAIGSKLATQGWPKWDRRGKALIVEGERPMDVASIDAMSDALEAIAAEYHVEFDGWKCAIIDD